MPENVTFCLPEGYSKSVCVVEMTIFVHWTCLNVNRKDVHASMISFNGKICNKNMCVKHTFEKMKLQLCFFLKTFSSQYNLFIYIFS